jgi:hypothetical protein
LVQLADLLVVEILFVVENELVDLLYMFGLLDAASGVDIVGRAVIENKLKLDLAVDLFVDKNDNDEIEIDCLY